MAIEAARLLTTFESNIARHEADMRRAEAAYKRAENQAISSAGRIKSAFSSGSGGGLLGGLTGGISGGGGGLLSSLGGISEVIQGIPVVGRMISGAVSTIAGPVKDFAALGITFNDTLEQARIGFETMIGSAEGASKHIKDLMDLAIKSPFKSSDLFRISPMLQGAGLAAKEVVPFITDFGDALSALGRIDAFDRVMLQMSQMVGKGRVMAQEMNSLAEAGLPAWKLLAEGIAKPGENVNKLAAKLRMSAEAGKPLATADVMPILREQLRSRYGGAMERVSQTRLGRMSTLEDITEQLAGRATAAPHADLSQGIETLNRRLQTPEAQNLANQIGAGAGKVSTQILGGFEGLIGSPMLARMMENPASAGSEVARGVADGIVAHTPQVFRSMSDMAYGGYRRFAEYYGIESPSRRMIEAGINLTQGLEIGIEMGAGPGYALIKDLANNSGGRFTAGIRSHAKRREENEELLKRPEVQAMMDAIGVGEGTFDQRTGTRRFDKWFGGVESPMGEDHPGLSPVKFFNKLKGKWDKSSAAGFGQFLKGTWGDVEKSVGPLNFADPHHQQIAFVERMRYRGMVDPLLRGDTAEAMRLGQEEWASLPGSPYKQRTVSGKTVLNTYQSRLGTYANGAPVSTSNPMPVIMVAGVSSAPGALSGVGRGGALYNEAELLARLQATRRSRAGAFAQQEGVGPVGWDDETISVNARLRDALNPVLPAFRELGEVLPPITDRMKGWVGPGGDGPVNIASLGPMPTTADDRAALDKHRERLRKQIGAGGGQLFGKFGLDRAGLADTFEGGLGQMLGSLRPGNLGSSFKQFGMGLLNSLQQKAGNMLANQITASIFGSKNDDGEMQGGLLSGLFGGGGGGGKGGRIGGLFSGLFGGGNKEGGGGKFGILHGNTYGGDGEEGGGGGLLGGLFGKGAKGIGSLFGKLFGGGRASGGWMDQNKFHLVGERGPELLGPGTPGKVTSNNDLAGMIKAQGAQTGGETRIINITEAEVMHNAVKDYLQTPRGGKLIVNRINYHRRATQQVIRS